MRKISDPIPENKKLWQALENLKQMGYIADYEKLPKVYKNSRAPAFVIITLFYANNPTLYVEYTTTKRLNGNNANSTELKNRKQRFSYYEARNMPYLKIPRSATVSVMEILIRKGIQNIQKE